MGNEAAKAKSRLQCLFTGKGLDIGCGSTPITDDCDRWDLEQGDAQYLIGVPDDTYDWIFSSHLLEHVKDPTAAIARWWKTLKIGGFLILLVPDEDLYEQGVWPSRFNSDHKHTFTLSKYESWSPVSVNCTDMLHALPGHKLVNLSIADTGYDYNVQDRDQSAGAAEVACQLVIRKYAVQKVPYDQPAIINACHFTSINGS